MRRSIAPMLSALALCCLASAVRADYQVVYDQGPSTGLESGAFHSITGGENFSDSFQFNADTTVNGLNYFTNIDLSTRAGDGDFRVRFASDPSLPGPVGSITGTQGYTSFESIGHGLYRMHFEVGAITFIAGQKWFAGVSGNGFDAGALGIESPGDGQMAQFSGDTFQGMQPVGDLMFQLTVGPIPEPGSATLFAGGALVLALVVARRRRSAVPARASLSPTDER